MSKFMLSLVVVVGLGSLLYFDSFALSQAVPVSLNPVFGFSDAGNSKVNGYTQLNQTFVSGQMPAYLIPEIGTVGLHVNAADLDAGTTKIGKISTMNGTVPGTAPSQGTPGSDGPFSNSNFFANDGGAFSTNAGPWTMVILASSTAYASNLMMQSGTTSTNGWYLQVVAAGGGSMAFVDGKTNLGASPSPSNIFQFNGSVNVLMFGIDGSGNAWSQLNGGTAVNQADALTVGNLYGTVGNGTAASAAWNGEIYEIMESNATPSAANFATIYNGVIQGLLSGEVKAGAFIGDGGWFGQETIGSGTVAFNHCFNVCSLSSQTCNVTCPGNQGTSTCHAYLVGVNSNTLPCRAVADAGSATIICGTASAGDAGVDCWN